MPCIDGIRIDVFEPGRTYAVGTLLACLFVAEEWAEPVDPELPASVVWPEPLTAADAPTNLARDTFPPQCATVDDLPGAAAVQ